MEIFGDFRSASFEEKKASFEELCLLLNRNIL